MPCDSSYMNATSTEISEAKDLQRDLITLADHLVVDNDALREYVLSGVAVDLFRLNLDYEARYNELVERNEGLYDMVQLSDARFAAVQKLVYKYNALNDLVVNQRKPSAAVLKKIQKDQTEHRLHDLHRLAKKFAESFDREKLSKVINADPTKPLKEQLGFDPDEF